MKRLLLRCDKVYSDYTKQVVIYVSRPPGPQIGRYIAKIAAGGNQGNRTRNRQVLNEIYRVGASRKEAREWKTKAASDRNVASCPLTFLLLTMTFCCARMRAGYKIHVHGVCAQDKKNEFSCGSGNHLHGVAACVHLGSVNGFSSLCAFVQCERCLVLLTKLWCM